ncbi:V-type ATP synthase subunit A [Candidatus Bathyarchaeota archaeon RBG_13_38_9]|nr:MAG: V-type ATP synthase subunit A [Candidatus Bathyarchaeota archaeon RBG_13_38_9]
MFKLGKIENVAGPVIVGKDMLGSQMYELVKIGDVGLIGEIIRIEGARATIQVYEETTGIKPGEKIERTGKPLSVDLGPGIIGQTYDGIQRPLPVIKELYGDFIERGINVSALDRKKKWKFIPTQKKNWKVQSGDIIGTVEETSLVKHRILVPPGVVGTILSIVDEGEYTVDDEICIIETTSGKKSAKLAHTWPVRTLRPFKRKIPSDTPLITGQRIIDFLFPIAKGGTAAIPGGFGTGKTVMQHQLAQWADADIIVYVGCGERGNEMAEVLERFPQLKDPRSGESLMARTILIANTSNMPIAAREASVYTGITISEYFRDMGYDVALMADSTSRWAEALREISGRLEEMPGEEGYPAYLASRLAEFYERSGRVDVLGSESKLGSVSVVGAVSPPGSDFSEPVTQNTLRIVKVFWALDKALAERRHFPAISWLTSYSLYFDSLQQWYQKNIAEDWVELRREAMQILQRDEELREIVMLVGPDALSESQRVTLEAARMLKEDFLVQSAVHPIDSYCPLNKSYNMIKIIMRFYRGMLGAIEKGIPLQRVIELPVKDEIARMKIQAPEDFDSFSSEFLQKIDVEFTELTSQIISA